MNIYVISREGYDKLYWGERYMAGMIGSVMSAAPDIRPILLTEPVWSGVSFTTFDYAAGCASKNELIEILRQYL